MAKKPNYDFEKRRKELDRKAKKDARREEKQRRREAGAAGGESAPIDVTTGLAANDAPAGD